MNSRLASGALMLFALLASRDAHAALITYDYSATITSVQKDDFGVLSPLGGVIGGMGSGTITWDTESILGPFDAPGFYTDRLNHQLSALTFHTDAGLLVTSNFGSGNVLVATPVRWIFNNDDNIQTNAGFLDFFLVNLTSSSGSALRTDVPILQAFDPTVLDQGTIRFMAGASYSSPTAVDYTATITDVRAVPEPRTWMLVGSAFLFVLVRRFRRAPQAIR